MEGVASIFCSNRGGGGPAKASPSIFGSLDTRGGVHTSYSIRDLMPLLEIFIEYRVRMRRVEYAHKEGGGSKFFWTDLMEYHKKPIQKHFWVPPP